MPNRHRSVEELAAVIQRVADGESCIQRMQELIDRATARGEDTRQLKAYLDEMHVIQRSFRESRDLLQVALQEPHGRTAAAGDP